MWLAADVTVGQHRRKMGFKKPLLPHNPSGPFMHLLFDDGIAGFPGRR
jgi:hypothetical protein